MTRKSLFISRVENMVQKKDEEKELKEVKNFNASLAAKIALKILFCSTFAQVPSEKGRRNL